LIAYAAGFEGDIALEHDAPEYEIDKEYPMLEKYYGLISGPLFLLPMATSGIFMGMLVDRYSRKWLLVTGCLVWSLCTFMTGYIKDFYGLVAMRFLLGVFESVCNPAAYSLIRDYFPPTSRATANAVYSSGIYVGSAISSISIVLINAFMWRGAFMFTGAIGGCFAVLAAITLREPARPEPPAPKK